MLNHLHKEVHLNHQTLETHGLHDTGKQYWNLSTPSLYEQAIRRNEGYIAHLGPLVVETGKYTGRSPNDKFLVEEPEHKEHIDWGSVNRPISEAKFDMLHQRVRSYLQGREVFIQDCFVGADKRYQLPVRIITEEAWHSLFVRNMFIQAKAKELAEHEPQFTVIQVPNCKAVPELDGTNSEAFVCIHFGKRLVLIGGTRYAGEIKKSMFTVMNYLLPQQDVMPMHCSANRGIDDKVALFFGLSGTGKTTLSNDADRTLIGDDEHGWSDQGVFNFEGGCYAKTIRLSATAEPEIYQATRRFGTVLENVEIHHKTRRVDLDNDSRTENTRAAYPIAHISNATRSGQGGHPSNIVMLTADAFGVLPPVAQLSPDQAVYHFLSGYTAKVAGTERGITEPVATFSACFGDVFMVHDLLVYADLLKEKIIEHDVDVWLINTGWIGGPYGVGSRINIRYTRSMVQAALNGTLAAREKRTDPIFNLQVPLSCPSVPDEVLDPRSTWNEEAAYEAQAQKLAQMFVDNFARFEGRIEAGVVSSGPQRG